MMEMPDWYLKERFPKVSAYLTGEKWAQGIAALRDKARSAGVGLWWGERLKLPAIDFHPFGFAKQHSGEGIKNDLRGLGGHGVHSFGHVTFLSTTPSCCGMMLGRHFAPNIDLPGIILDVMLDYAASFNYTILQLNLVAMDNRAILEYVTKNKLAVNDWVFNSRRTRNDIHVMLLETTKLPV